MSVRLAPIDAIKMLHARIRSGHTDALAKVDSLETELVVCQQVISFINRFCSSFLSVFIYMFFE